MASQDPRSAAPGAIRDTCRGVAPAQSGAFWRIQLQCRGAEFDGVDFTLTLRGSQRVRFDLGAGRTRWLDSNC